MPIDDENLINNEGQEGVVDSHVDEDIDIDDYEDEEDLEEDVSEHDGTDDFDYEEDEEESENDSEVADRKQSKEENAVYAKMRRKAEQEAQIKLERERQELERMRQQIEYENRIREAVSDEKVWEKADELGVSEDVARTILKQELELQQIREREQRIAFEQSLERQFEQYKHLPNFDRYKDEIRNVAINNPQTFNVEVAYDYFHGKAMREGLNNEVNNIKKRTQQRIVADIQDRARRSGSVVTSSTGGKDDIDYRKVLTPTDIEMARAFGTDPSRVAKYVKSSKKNKKG